MDENHPPPQSVTVAEVYMAPETVDTVTGRSVFLAGSIPKGPDGNWQAKLTQRLAHLPITIFNPRRDDWDSSWVERMSDPRFATQVNWELDKQQLADVIVFYFHPETQAPITLLELGQAARTGKAVVYCPDGYWRKGNVEIVCERWRLPLVVTFEELVAEVIKKLGHLGVLPWS